MFSSAFTRNLFGLAMAAFISLNNRPLVLQQDVRAAKDTILGFCVGMNLGSCFARSRVMEEAAVVDDP